MAQASLLARIKMDDPSADAGTGTGLADDTDQRPWCCPPAGMATLLARLMARSQSAGRRAIPGLSDALAADRRRFRHSWPTAKTLAWAEAAEGRRHGREGDTLWRVLFVAGLPQARWFLHDSKAYRVSAPDGLTPL